jgi:hypothetical protein
MTDREILRSAIDISSDEWEESRACITVKGGPKYIFYADGTLRSVINNGRSYGPNGARRGGIRK